MVEELTDEQAEELEMKINEIWDLLFSRRATGELKDRKIIEKTRKLVKWLKEIGIE